MSFLTLNSTPIRCRKDACDVKDAEHRADRARAFDGTPRVTSGGVFREFTIVTGLLNASDYAAYRALINTSNPPLTAAGDLIGATSISVFPIPGSWTPLATPSESNGFRRQAKFTLWESPTISAPDTSAVPWAFYRRGVGYFTDLAKTTPAAVDDLIRVWTDQSGNARDATSGSGLVGGTDDNRPTRIASNELLFGHNPDGAAERSGIVVPSMSALSVVEMLIGVRAENDPPATGSLVSRVLFNMSSSGGVQSYYPTFDGPHLRQFRADGGARHDRSHARLDRMERLQRLRLQRDGRTDFAPQQHGPPHRGQSVVHLEPGVEFHRDRLARNGDRSRAHSGRRDFRQPAHDHAAARVVQLHARRYERPAHRLIHDTTFCE
jgi:hypothetical protein